MRRPDLAGFADTDLGVEGVDQRVPLGDQVAQGPPQRLVAARIEGIERGALLLDRSQTAEAADRI